MIGILCIKKVFTKSNVKLNSCVSASSKYCTKCKVRMKMKILCVQRVIGTALMSIGISVNI